ncbi:MAG: DEAD/DEAH box helicase [Firmicutes bacterium]|nr:DEAD/DEAH box helicase [Bacillota bacterium]
MITFNQLGLSDSVMKALNDMGFEEATPIQEQTIPAAMNGRDIIGQAQTGTGKTASFGIPMVERFEPNAATRDIQGLVIAPTRELAVQVSEELYKIGQFKGIRTLPVYGGQDIGRQIKGLKNRPHIVVGTPGRLLDHIRRRTLRLHNVQVAVLDEADEMLNMGFIQDIEAILAEMPEERQTLLFSATMPPPIRRLAEKFMREPEYIAVRSKEMTVPSIAQKYMEVNERQKFEVLCRLLDIQPPELAIVFGRTKRRVDELTDGLKKRGYSAEGIHGDLTQARRDAVMRQFRDGSIDVLVATDVAARGLDISGVSHVYNFDIPQDPDSYVHRIGRTGRAGQNGEAMTFVTHRELYHLRTIERLTKRKIERAKVPSDTDALAGQQRMTVERLLGAIEENETSRYRSMAEQMLAENDSVTVLAAALKLLTGERDTTPIQLTDEPMYSKRPPRRNNNHRGERRPYPKQGGYRKKHR